MGGCTFFLEELIFLHLPDTWVFKKLWESFFSFNLSERAVSEMYMCPIVRILSGFIYGPVSYLKYLDE